MDNAILLPLWLLALTASANLLKNPDFESPPTNLTPSSTSKSFVPLNSTATTIPGWQFEGEVQYVTSGKEVRLPGNGHAIMLGREGTINQSFTPSGDFTDYIATFALASSLPNCSAAVIVSGPDTGSNFTINPAYGKEPWELHGSYLGSWDGEGPPMGIVFHSMNVSDSSCWPIVGSVIVKRALQSPVQNDGNLLLNGGFEVGPDFPPNSTEGILLESGTTPIESPLQPWSVLGGVKYISSKNFFVPSGRAAIEIISGASAGVQTSVTITEGSNCALDFSLGDASDGCVGDFLVGVQAGSAVQNFTVRSNGAGSARNFTLGFMAERSSAPVSFLSYSTTKTKDGIFCGPVVDNVVLRASQTSGGNGRMQKTATLVVAFLLIFAIFSYKPQ